MHTVESLRSQGYKVRVKHYRIPSWDERFQQIVLSPRGGFTVVDVTPPEGCRVSGGIAYGLPEYTVSGISRCNTTDNYCRKTGVKLALNRCLEKIGLV